MGNEERHVEMMRMPDRGGFEYMRKGLRILEGRTEVYQLRYQCERQVW